MTRWRNVCAAPTFLISLVIDLRLLLALLAGIFSLDNGLAKTSPMVTRRFGKIFQAEWTDVHQEAFDGVKGKEGQDHIV